MYRRQQSRRNPCFADVAAPLQPALLLPCAAGGPAAPQRLLSSPGRASSRPLRSCAAPRLAPAPRARQPGPVAALRDGCLGRHRCCGGHPRRAASLPRSALRSAAAVRRAWRAAQRDAAPRHLGGAGRRDVRLCLWRRGQRTPRSAFHCNGGRYGARAAPRGANHLRHLLRIPHLLVRERASRPYRPPGGDLASAPRCPGLRLLPGARAAAAARADAAAARRSHVTSGSADAWKEGQIDYTGALGAAMFTGRNAAPPARCRQPLLIRAWRVAQGC